MTNTSEHASVKARLESFASGHGYVLSPNADAIITGMLKKKEKFGDYYCPCRVQRIDENVCPCVHVHDEVKEKGHCHCKLFYIKNDEEMNQS